MQPSLDPLSNARSGLPVPSTNKKPSAHSANPRMSLAGPALRAPMPQVPGSNPRHSMMRSQNNPLLQSTSKPNYGRTPMSNSIRRGSLWGGGTAMAAPQTSQAQKDTRPLRDRPFQTKMRQDVFHYLNESGFEISMQSLTSMQGKDYRAIFDTLLLTLDPCYPLREGARFEDEFIPALKALKYPFAHQIDPKWLAAVASPHSWPYMLGMRNWYLESEDPTLLDPTLVPEEFDDPFDHKTLAYQYLEETYGPWLDGADDLSQMNEMIEERYQKKDERVRLIVEQEMERLSHIKSEYNKTKSSAAIAELKKRNEQLQKDCEKLKKILERYEGRRDKLIEQIAYEKAELAKGGELPLHILIYLLDDLKGELNKLEEQVKVQNLSPEEVIKMNTDREMLTRNLEDLKQKLAETQKTVHNLEIKVTNRAAAVEEALDTYTNMLSSLELFPTPPEPWQDVDLTLELNSASANPQQLLLGLDIRETIKPTLSSVAEAKRAERADVENESVRVTDQIDQVTTESKNLEFELVELEKKATALNEQADDLRDAAQRDAQVASAEASRLERELAHALASSKANGLQAKTQLKALQFKYKEQVEQVSRLKDELARAILKNTQEITQFKHEVSRHLQDLRDFAEAE
ncbi:hypothetical protein CVT26_002766 [Gymnopilus dilepis]|uniref:Kinetochore protein NDC80 n=1 Tax=Gymnopilus dilepis TaxID=231916 RepID=A0A409VCA0_9AGAR|nr:hypothetical protein CVT26_002766 [Gymnopilus dilepis]